jgi:gamma-glutamyltranspeptidase/glutathione hydrolase
LPDGHAPRLTPQEARPSRLDTSALAETLARIAKEGPSAFYRGDVARALAAHVRRLGGILSEEDLASYRPRVVRESPGRYRDLDFVSCCDHVAYEALHLLDGFDLAALDPESAEHRHLVAESLAVSFTDCMAHYGDPEHVESPVSGLKSRDYAAHRRGELRKGHALARPVVPGDPWPFDDGSSKKREVPAVPAPVARGGTSQMVAADADGNVVSIITAVGWTFGSLVYCPETGVFLNNGMSYFDPRPNKPSSIAPGKMPMFGAPALVATRGDSAAFAAAGSGGYRIETGVLSALINVADHDMSVDEALALPRVHCQGGPTYVDGRVALETREALEAFGHEVVVLEQDVDSLGFGRVCAVKRERDGSWSASGEPLWTTAVAAV